MDMFDRKEVKADQFEKGTITDIDSIAGRYAAKSRKTTVKVFTKSATLWELCNVVVFESKQPKVLKNTVRIPQIVQLK